MTTNQATKTQIEQLNEEIESQKLAQVVKLSKRSMAVAVLLSCLFPIGGYIYTRRWLPLLWFMLGGFLIGVTVSVSEPDPDEAAGMAFNLSVIYGAIVAPLDNGQAIARSRQRVSDLSQ